MLPIQNLSDNPDGALTSRDAWYNPAASPDGVCGVFMTHRSLLLCISLLAVATGLPAASTIYFGTQFGPYKSTDSGVTFTQLGYRQIPRPSKSAKA